MSYLSKKLLTIIQSLNSWVLKTTNLVVMTSNTAPSPFVASMITGKTSGEAYQVFDTSTSTGVQANYFSPSTLGLGVKLLFGKNIRISKLKLRGNRSGQSIFTGTVYGIKPDDTKVLIYQNSSLNVNTDVTVDSTDKNTEFKGIESYIDTRGDLIVNLYTTQVVEYYERG